MKEFSAVWLTIIEYLSIKNISKIIINQVFNKKKHTSYLKEFKEEGIEIIKETNMNDSIIVDPVE
jgi:hypothetical protein